MQINLFVCNPSEHTHTWHSAFHTAEGEKCSSDSVTVISCKEFAAIVAGDCEDA